MPVIMVTSRTSSRQFCPCPTGLMILLQNLITPTVLLLRIQNIFKRMEVKKLTMLNTIILMWELSRGHNKSETKRSCFNKE